MNRKVYQAIGALSLLTLTSPLYATNFSGFYFFGDSSSDIGNNPAAPYTNNPPGLMYPQYLVSKYGQTVIASSVGGTDYAYGGATTYDLAGQLAQLQANNKQLDSQAVYSVYVGMNDLNALFLPQANLDAIVNQAADNIVTMLTRLHQSGARFLIVPNWINVGLIPNVRNYLPSPLREDFINAGATLNAQMLNKINQLPFDVIQVDMYGFAEQLIANPGAYGITNIEQPCTSTAECQSFLFSGDGQHPATIGQKLTADYIYGVLTAPEFAGLLAELPSMAYSSQIKAIQQNLPPQSEPLPAGKVAAFAVGSYSQDKAAQTLSNTSSSYASNNSGVTVGLRYAVNQLLTLGTAFSYSDNRSTFDMFNNSSINWRSNLFALFANLNFPRAYLNAVINYGTLKFYEVDRMILLGPKLDNAQADLGGHLFGAHLDSGYHLIKTDQVTSGPFASIDYQKINVDAYTEQGAGASNISFENQKRDYFTTGLGWQINFKHRFGQVDTLSHIFIAGNRQWLTGNNPDGSYDVQFHVASLPGSHASLPVQGMATSFLSTGLNVAAGITPKTTVSLGYEFDKGNYGLQQHNVLLSLQYTIN